MTEPEPLPLVKISRFGGLNRHEVLEVHDTAWPEFLAHLEADPLRAFRGKYNHPGWSPAIFDPPIRDRANVRSVAAIVIDFNKGTPFERATEGWADWFGVVYTTKGHTEDASRLRIVLPLARPVSADEHSRIWSWVAGMCTSMGLAIAADPADPAAFWYDATTPRGGWRSARLTGAVLDPGPILSATPPAPRPPAPALRLITAADIEPPPIGTLAAKPAPNWRDHLARKSNGIHYLKSYRNAYLILMNHEAWAGRWTYNEMTLTPTFKGKEPALNLPDECRRVVEEQYGGLQIARSEMEHAILDVCLQRPFHPVRDYLRGLQWDGVDRLIAVARDNLHTSSPLHASLLRKWFLSAVARVMWPGCKVDTTLVLVGEKQGRQKSTFFSALGEPWFSDSRVDLDKKDAMQQLRYAWIHEWSEIERVVNEKREIEAKGFLSSPSDLFRAPYAAAPAFHPRTNVIAGTTNKVRFLTDPTGSRRYWPVPIADSVDIDSLRRVRDQLWAEAVAIYDDAATCAACAPLLPHKRCERHRWWLSDDEDDAREAEADEHRTEDTWVEPIEAWIGRRSTTEPLTTAAILSGIGIVVMQQDPNRINRVGRAMRALGYEVKPQGSDRKRVWVKG